MGSCVPGVCACSGVAWRLNGRFVLVLCRIRQLFAANPNEVHRHLLACCLIYSNEKARAVIVLRDSTAPTNRSVSSGCGVTAARAPA
jgi:hypothetical protein